MNKQELISLAKEKGFKSVYFVGTNSDNFYENAFRSISDDLSWLFWLTECQKWLRDIHKINVFVRGDNNFENDWWLYWYIIQKPFYHHVGSCYEDPDEALQEGIEKALKLIN